MAELYKKTKIAGVNLFLTRSCNLRCRYCFVEKRTGQFDRALVPAVAHFLRDSCEDATHGTHVGYIGGEPMVAWPLFREVTAALRSGGAAPNIGMTTNGTLLDPERIRFLRENDIRVVLSFDGDLTSMQDRVFCDGRPSYKAVRRGMDMLMEAGIPFLVQMTITPANAASLCTNIRHLAELGARRIIFGFCLEGAWTPGAANSLAASLAAIFSLCKTIYRENRDLDLKYVRDETLSFLLARSGRSRIREACPMGSRVCAIDIDGTIYPCQALVNYPEWRIGHVATGIDPLRQDALSTLANDEMQPCTACDLRMFCRKCPRSNYLTAGDPFRTDRFSCFLGKTTFALVRDFVRTMIEEHNRRFLAEVGGLIQQWRIDSI